MGLYPVKCTVSVPCSGLAVSDAGLTLKWDNATGKLVKGTDGARPAGKCVVVDKNLDQCTLEYAGILRLPVADSVNLTAANLGQKVTGGANGTVKPIATPTAAAVTDITPYYDHAEGRILDYSNIDGDKYVDVAGYFG